LAIAINASPKKEHNAMRIPVAITIVKEGELAPEQKGKAQCTLAPEPGYW
jgi:hypothetical protein